ncbi:MAG: TonB-dependent receptor [Gammaproteobacteria bacterium]|nr:TonB-dependent receptor [Gammaproteobacteria bacterium]
MLKTRNITILVSLLLSNSLVFSESNLNEILVSPESRSTTIFDSLSSVEVITSADIELLGYSTVDEILSHSSSINIGSNGGYGQTKSIFMRGTESNHTKVLINGVELNPGTLGVASIQHISVEMLDRIEISKGSMSTLYGKNTIGGVINIILKKDLNSNKGKLYFKTGRDKTNKIGFQKNFSYKNHNIMVNFMSTKTNGYKAKVTSTKNHGYENKNIDINYFFNENNNLFNINFYQSDGNTEYDSFGSNLNQDHKDGHIKLSWNKKYIESESIIVLIHKQNKINQNAFSATDYTHTENYQIKLEKNYYNLNGANTLLGMMYTNETLYELSYGTRFNKSNITTEYYAQSEYYMGDALYNIGSRYINHSQYGGFLAGNFNIGYNLTSNSKIIAGIGKSFRSPDGTDLFGYEGNPNLEPEESISREISLKYKINDNSGLIITLFNNNISNLIESDGSIMQNINMAKIEGLEFSFYDTYSKINYSLDYSFINARDITNNVKLSRRPSSKFVGRINYNYDLNNIFSLSSISETNSDNSIYDNDKLGGYTSINAMFLRKSEKYDIQLKFNNIFDKKYRKAHNYNSEGRSYSFSVSRSF